MKKICLSEAQRDDEVVSIDEALEIYNQIRSEMVEFMMQQQQDIISSEPSPTESQTTSRVVCPLCQKENLEMVEASGRIECGNCAPRGRCEFKVEPGRVRDLDELAERLQAAAQQHPCADIPKFLFRFLDDSDNGLVFYCESCGFLKEIL